MEEENKNNNFIFKSFELAVKSLKYKFLMLGIILGISVFLVDALSDAITDKFKDNNFKIEVGLVNLDNNTTTEFLLNFMLNTGEIVDNFNVSIINSEDDALELINNNDIMACIVIPQDFLTSVLNASNYSPKLILNTKSSLEIYLIKSLAENLEAMMKNTQSAIYMTLDNIASSNVNQELIMQINLDYINVLLDRDTIFDKYNIEYVNKLSIWEHYFLIILIYILFLTTPLFFNELNLSLNKNILKQLSLVEKNFKIFYLSKLLMIILAYFIIFIGLIFYLNISVTLILLISIINSLVFMLLFQSIFFNKFNDFIVCSQANFIFNTMGLIICGGVVPTLFLPKVITIFENLSPMYYIKNMLSILFIGDSSMLYLNIIIFIINVIISKVVVNKLDKLCKE